jgi:hypothetical protein
MDIGSIFLILALFLLTALYIGRPIYDRSRTRASAISSELSALMAEYDRVLTALSELDFDNALGKIPAEDYPLRRTELAQRGAALLRQLDEHDSSYATTIGSSPLDAKTAAPDDDLETLIANRRRGRQGKSGGFCPQCGGPTVQSDRFCPKCGVALS